MGDCYFNLTTPAVNLQGMGYEFVTQDEEKLKSVIYNTGPVAAIFKGDDDFMAYKGGIFDTSTCQRMTLSNMFLLIVGYGSENGVPFWIVQNSMGTEWGE